ncbi:Cysteine-rich secretory protein family [Cylindrospermum stagnale PCC 7417]|uniref:Cysteine-rich secretory protein family n=1 Tax=Cylindrospermum stagnale PCC 7417 TaxID=56107 RepID=K9X085_9NOST|nr:CAP family protein [Cylindrospermum stagnale]AFZ26025.1 Cysteine-rich secretory protein family [Cylindrospermum stagnale PCC 7417]
MNKLFSTLSLTAGTALTLILTAIAPSQLAGISSGPVMGQTSIDLATFRNSALSKHNGYRVTHSSPNMTISDSVNNTAQAWAEYLATNAVLQHSTASQRNNAGENLYVSYTTASSIAASTLADTAVKKWYDEVSAYNYANPGFSSQTGHFTQVVWKSSTQLGCGAAQGTKTINGTTYKAFYVVCQYAPAGNMQGQFPANVLQP